MKKASILITILFAFIPTFLSTNAFAQTDTDQHTKLTALNKAIMKSATAIEIGETKTKDEKVKEAEKAIKNLNDAKKLHEEMKKSEPEMFRGAAKPHHEKIKKEYKAETTHLNALSKELKKDKPDNEKIKEHAKKLHESVGRVEKEHQELIKKTK
jgi:hypothetical protein